jgi:uncharacterized membrane protein YbhN (UPF0104 family)
MHLQWEWLPLAIFCEFASIAAVAHIQRRLLRASGARVPLGSVMAVTSAGNAVSAFLRLAGPFVLVRSSSFVLRSFVRRGLLPKW